MPFRLGLRHHACSWIRQADRLRFALSLVGLMAAMGCQESPDQTNHPAKPIAADALISPQGQSVPPAYPAVVAEFAAVVAGDTVLVAEAEEMRVDWHFENQARQRSLVHWGRTGDSLDKPGIMLYQTLGCGGGTIDFDLDGWSDLYLLAAGGMPPETDSSPNELFRNHGGGFKTVGAIANVDHRGFGQGVAVGDVNEDGFPDLLVLNYGPNRLLVNNGDGTFRDDSFRMPPGEYDEWSSSGAIADLDGDGLSDIVVVNYCGGLGPVIQSCKVRGSDLVRSCAPMLFTASPDRFLANDGLGGFHDATVEWLGETVSSGRGLGIVVGNLDGNEGNDIFVANDMTANQFYAGNPMSNPHRLSESAMSRGLAADANGKAQGSMGIAAADLDGDGDLDFYVTNFENESNSLLLQSSNGVWEDRTSVSKLDQPTLPHVGFGTQPIDIDNSGDVELVVANGHVDLFSWGSQRVPYQQPAQIIARNRDNDFQMVRSETLGEYFNENHVGRGVWTIDFNRDGMLDLVATHQTEPIALLANQTQTDHSWVRLQLHGRDAARDAVGAVVRVRIGQSVLYGHRLSGNGYQCSNEQVIHIGLGETDAKSVDVTVRWPGGENEFFRGVTAKTGTHLVEGSGLSLEK